MKSVYYLTFYSYCGKNLDYLIKMLSKLFSISVSQLPKKKKKFVVIKSPHVFNKSKEHFETIVFKKLVLIVFDKYSDQRILFEKILKGFFWSVFGLSIKKTKLSKNCFYI
jgi:ribosomal protein S10